MIFLTTKETAEALKISPTRVRQMLQDNVLKGEKIGRDWMIDPRSVEARKKKMDKKPSWAKKMKDQLKKLQDK